MPMLLRPALKEVRTWGFDSRRWAGYAPRSDDIVIATYPKCGTTWMQRIVCMLVFRSVTPRPLGKVSPWLDSRRVPIRETLDEIEAQTHRRFIKSHLPLDALPLYEEVRYIHVARDGRDACASFHNHVQAYTARALSNLDRNGMEDESVGRPFPRAADSIRSYFRDWIAADPANGPAPGMDFFAFERSYWDERARSNLLLVHYNDLKDDLAGEVRRIAAFLEIECSSDLLADITAAASFDAMRRDGEQLLPDAGTFQGGAGRFLYKGTNGRWRDELTAEDIALYDARSAAGFDADCAAWVSRGRRGGAVSP